MTEELKLNNLYQNGIIYQFEDGKNLLDREPVNIEPTLSDDYHTYIKGQELDQLAYLYYKDIVPDPSKFWWLIADANNIVNPLDLDYLEGTEIIIPNITKALLRLNG